MSDPWSHLSLALAAANGQIDSAASRRLVSAGVALLQHCAPLVRALHGRRSAILLPFSPAFVVALAASEGREGVLLDSRASAVEIDRGLHDGNVGAVFTVSALEDRVPAAVPRILLDAAPRSATWRVGSSVRDIDLSLHDGLPLEGERGAVGVDEACLRLAPNDPASAAFGGVATHRQLMTCARSTALAARLSPRDNTLSAMSAPSLFSVVVGGLAPLLASGRVTTVTNEDPATVIERIEREGVSMVVAPPSLYASLLDAIDRRGRRLDAPILQRCIAGMGVADQSLRTRWLSATGVALRQGDETHAGGDFSVGGPAPSH